MAGAAAVTGAALAAVTAMGAMMLPVAARARMMGAMNLRRMLTSASPFRSGLHPDGNTHVAACRHLVTDLFPRLSTTGYGVITIRWYARLCTEGSHHTRPRPVGAPVRGNRRHPPPGPAGHERCRVPLRRPLRHRGTAPPAA